MNFLSKNIFRAGIFFVVSGISTDTEITSWKSTDGIEIEAKILAVRDGTVVLERADGREFAVPISRFSDKDQNRIREWNPPPIEVPTAENAVMILETEKGRGSAFLLQKDGRVYLYTNQHVLGDMAELSAKDLGGKSIKMGTLEIAVDRDLARMRVEERRGLLLAGQLQTGMAVTVYGNSQGSGVITRSEGKVVGLSPTVLEVSSEIVAGNSGGPVVNEHDEVLGVSSFVTFGNDRLDPTVKGTRFENPRRFALRLDSAVDFTPVRWEDFTEAYTYFEQATIAYDEALQVTRTLVESPSQILLEDSFKTDGINRIARSHNRDLRRVPDVVYSEIELRNARRQISRRLMRNLRDAFGEAETSLAEASRKLDASTYGWMQSELERRKEMLSTWQDFLDQYFETLR